MFIVLTAKVLDVLRLKNKQYIPKMKQQKTSHTIIYFLYIIIYITLLYFYIVFSHIVGIIFLEVSVESHYSNIRRLSFHILEFFLI